MSQISGGLALLCLVNVIVAVIAWSCRRAASRRRGEIWIKREADAAVREWLRSKVPMSEITSVSFEVEDFGPGPDYVCDRMKRLMKQ